MIKSAQTLTTGGVEKAVIFNEDSSDDEDLFAPRAGGSGGQGGGGSAAAVEAHVPAVAGNASAAPVVGPQNWAIVVHIPPCTSTNSCSQCVQARDFFASETNHEITILGKACTYQVVSPSCGVSQWSLRMHALITHPVS
jgi:hypothetical protein